MDEDRRTTRVKVSGRVQRVGFRAWAREQAQALGLDGWVRNRPDGSVEAVLAGPPDALERMIEALGRGPTLASVDRVERLDAPPLEEPGFRVLR